MSKLPKRWHLYVVDVEPRVGTKPGKQRPCLVIQPDDFAESGLASSVILPLTTNLVEGNAWPLRVRIPKGICGLKKTSDVLVDQILAREHTLFSSDLGELPEALREEIKSALREFLDLE